MLILLVVIVVAAVLFAVGAFIAGRLDGAVRWPPDAKPFPLPEGRLDAGEVARARFSIAFRGYRMADVDAALWRIAGELAARDAELDLIRGGRALPARPDTEPAGRGSGVRLSKDAPTSPAASPAPAGAPASAPNRPGPDGIPAEPGDDA